MGHESCPASKSYTMEMLKEDWTMTFALMYCGCPSIFGPLAQQLPEGHPLWNLFTAIMPRYVKTSQVLDVPGFVIKTCNDLGLELDPAVNFPEQVESPTGGLQPVQRTASTKSFQRSVSMCHTDEQDDDFELIPKRNSHMSM